MVERNLTFNFYLRNYTDLVSRVMNNSNQTNLVLGYTIANSLANFETRTKGENALINEVKAVYRDVSSLLDNNDLDADKLLSQAIKNAETFEHSISNMKMSSTSSSILNRNFETLKKIDVYNDLIQFGDSIVNLSKNQKYSTNKHRELLLSDYNILDKSLRLGCMD